MFPEDPVEISQILITHCIGNPVHIPVGGFQQKGSLGQSLILHQLGEILSGFSLDLPG